MDMNFGSVFLKVDDLRTIGPVVVTITDITEGRYGKPNLHFDDETILSLNTTNGRVLARAYGGKSEDWFGKKIELSVGQTSYQGTLQDSIIARPISPPGVNKKPLKGGPKSGAGDMNDEIAF